MILTIPQLDDIRRSMVGRIVATTGAFDLLHYGHVWFLESARCLGDTLIVGVNGDESVRQLKGDGRPFNIAIHRAGVLHGLLSVDHVCIFEGVRCPDFLAAARPHIYVKGGDYDLGKLDESERAALGNADIRFLPLTPGLSTTAIAQRIAAK